MRVAPEERELFDMIGPAVARATREARVEARVEAAGHYRACLDLLGIGPRELLDAQAAGAEALERFVFDRLAGTSDVVWPEAAAHLRRTWVVLGVEPGALARWDEVVARVVVRRKRGRSC